MEKPKIDYSAEDLLKDNAFIDWLNNPNSKDNDWWNEWLRLHPEKWEEVDQAASLYYSLRATESKKPGSKAAEETWSRIVHTLWKEAADHAPATAKIGTILIYAACIGAAIIGLCGWFLWDKKVTISSHDTIRHIELSDGTHIVLNKHTELTYFEYPFIESRRREVWINGEAFFHVKKLWDATGTRMLFQVHAGPKLNVEVLGTRFNIVSRKHDYFIVLNTGMVAATYGIFTDTLRPGQMLEFIHDLPVKRNVTPQLYSAWKEGVLKFDNTPLTEVTDILRRNFGYEIRVKDSLKISSHKISGDVSTANQTVMLKSLAIALNVTILKQNNALTFKPR